MQDKKMPETLTTTLLKLCTVTYACRTNYWCAHYFSVLSCLIYWTSCHTADTVQSLSLLSQIRVHVSLVAW